jgi:hypothetical protein
MKSPRPAPRNRLAKPLPDRWRRWLVDQGVPRRKYSAILTATMSDGSVIENVVVEDGWIIAVGLEALAASTFEVALPIHPAQIRDLTLVSTV